MPSLRAVEIYHDAQSANGRKLIAIESVEFGHSKSNTGCHVHGFIAPLAVIIVTADDIQVLDLTSETSTLDTLRRDVPELDELIAPFLAEKMR